MKSFNASYDNKKNKEEIKIIFESFPGEQDDNKINKNIKKHKIKTYLLVFIILAILFIGSSFLNEFVLYNKYDGEYKLVNKFSGNYAVIKPSNRDDLFKRIGFDVSKSKTETMNDKNYITTYAYHKINENNNYADSISVYYDNYYTVSYIIMSLIYKKSEFNISKVSNECNSILKNFVNLNTSKNAITEVKNNEYYYLKKENPKIEISYRLKEENKNYYVLTVVVQNKSS